MVSWGERPDRVADGFAFGPFGHGFGAALVGDLEGLGHVLLQPLHQLLQEAVGLRFVGGFGVARGGGRKVQGRRIALQRGLKFLVGAFQAEEDLVT